MYESVLRTKALHVKSLRVSQQFYWLEKWGDIGLINLFVVLNTAAKKSVLIYVHIPCF